MKRINSTITDTQFQAIHELSVRTGLAFAEILRRALDRYLSSPDVTEPRLGAQHPSSPPPRD